MIIRFNRDEVKQLILKAVDETGMVKGISGSRQVVMVLEDDGEITAELIIITDIKASTKPEGDK